MPDVILLEGAETYMIIFRQIPLLKSNCTTFLFLCPVILVKICGNLKPVLLKNIAVVYDKNQSEIGLSQILYIFPVENVLKKETCHFF